MRFIRGISNEPDFNLAMEQYVFDELPQDDSYFMLWQNAPSVIIGKFQNAYSEVNREYTDRRGIPVVRRLSGGGAVYHDLGNINYTFIVSGSLKDSENLAVFCGPLVAVLEQFGIRAQISGRNDVLIDGMKVSGTAKYQKKGRIMHHGTILFQTDLSIMSEILHVSKVKMQAKGVTSVRSRVTNICDHLSEEVSAEQFMDAFRAYIGRETETKEYYFSETDIAKINRIREERYASWEWNWGSSRRFARIKETYIEGVGKLEIHMDIEKGRLQDCAVYGDFFGTGLSPDQMQILRGIRLRRDDVLAALGQLPIEQCIRGLDAQRFAQLLVY